MEWKGTVVGDIQNFNHFPWRNSSKEGANKDVRKKEKENYVGSTLVKHSLHQLRKGGHIGAQTV
eukprot:1154408-Pelagomonas_calceolata.AAC.5